MGVDLLQDCRIFLHIGLEKPAKKIDVNPVKILGHLIIMVQGVPEFFDNTLGLFDIVMRLLNLAMLYGDNGDIAELNRTFVQLPRRRLR